MKNGWPQIPLGEILRRSDEWISIDPQATYREVTVRLWGKGVTMRRECIGAEIKSDRRLRVRPGQFIASRIDARNGAFGLIPAELDGAVVTNDFPVFVPNSLRLYTPFLGWLSRTRNFVELCKAASEGTTNRVRLKEERFLITAIPLPPIEEQRQIVARIDAFVTKIAEARQLTDDVILEVEQLCRSLIFGQIDRCTPTQMGELVRRRPLDVEVRPDETYQFAGVYCFGRGVFRSKRISGNEFSYRQLTKLRTDDFIYPKLMAWEGALATVPKECDGCVVSPEFPVFAPDLNRVLPETLDVYFRTPAIWPALSGASTGTNVRRKRLNPDDFLAHRIPLPTMAVQRQLRALRRYADEIRQVQTAAAAELDALLPSILDRAFKGEL